MSLDMIFISHVARVNFPCPTLDLQLMDDHLCPIQGQPTRPT